MYISIGETRIYIDRYKKWLILPNGYPSNGANVVKDRCPTCFFFHDLGCNTGTWADGSKMSNWQLSYVYYDLLKYFGHDEIAWIRFWGTFIGGGGEAKKNGWWRVDD